MYLFNIFIIYLSYIVCLIVSSVAMFIICRYVLVLLVKYREEHVGY